MQSPYEENRLACPKCASTQIAVPWDAHASDARKQVTQLFLILWGTYPLWMLLSFIFGSPYIWMLPFSIYLVASASLANDYFLHLRSFYCSSCGLRWKGRRHRTVLDAPAKDRPPFD